MNAEPGAQNVEPQARNPEPRTRSFVGFTLTELLFAELALLILAFVLPAWLAVRVNHVRIARAEREARTIAEAIERFERDLGTLPAWRRAEDWLAGREQGRVEVLVGPGDAPRFAPVAVAGWASGRVDTVRNQLVDDGPGYVRLGVDQARASRWRGPYLARPPGPDPWQNRYMVNVGAPAQAGEARAGSFAPVVVFSAGPNGIVETPYALFLQDPHPGGDDVVVVVHRPPS